MRNPLSFALIAAAGFLATVGPAAAAGPPTRCVVTWTDGIPAVEVTVDRLEKPAEGVALAATATLFDGAGKQLWAGPVPIAFKDAAPWRGTAKVSPKPLNVDAQYRVEVRLNAPELGLVHAESVVFSGPSKPVLFRAMRRSGVFPNEKVQLAIRLAGAADRAKRAVTLDWTLRDAAENILAQKQQPIPGGERAVDHEIEIVPDRRAVGPFTVECNLASDAGLDLSWTEKFPYATALVPVSSMETDDLTEWFRSSFPDPNRLSLTPQGVPFTSMHAPEPAVFDAGVSHGGTRSLRLDYKEGKPAAIYADIGLPGFPVRARVWVKGNGTRDRLVVHWHDRYMTISGPADYGVPKLFSERAVVGTLDFEGWRCFTVPVLGGGLQSTKKAFYTNRGIAEGSEDVPTVPIMLYAFSVEPEQLPKGQQHGDAKRTIWIDDLSVETQLPFDRRASMELRGDTPDRRLHDKAELLVSIGNGADTMVKDGRLNLTAKDRGGKAVGEVTETIDVKPGEFGVKTILLDGLAKGPGEGPIDIDVMFTDPATAVRIAKRVVFKRANAEALYWNFERPATFGGVLDSPVKSFSTVAGGAVGSARALAVTVTSPEVSVVLHPSLPGITDRVEVQVKGSGVPVDLYPVFLDAGNTGAGTPFNQFRQPPIRVDWQGWRKIEFAAPPVPANYDDRTAAFLLKARHPLNLAFTARQVDGKPANILMDEIRVRTHLPPTERLTIDIDHPDDFPIHPPGAPLKLALTNFADTERKVRLAYTLRNLRDADASRSELEVVVPAGGRSLATLVNSLEPGLYSLDVEGPDGDTLEAAITVLDARAFFGDPPGKTLENLQALEKSLGMTVRKANLDWDNLEKVPGVFTFKFFHNDVAKLREQGYRVLPGLGFSADWAGPEQQENVAKGEYSRYIGNQLQTPVRLADWSSYAREVFREYKGQFDAWSFWENPDIMDGSTAIDPAKYPAMLGVLKQWQSMYDPESKLIADGFNSDHVLSYLDRIPEPHTLPFDMFGVQMRIGELAPEEADLEGLLADLDQTLKLRETGRQVTVPSLDWSVGRFVSLADQAAYHSRARLMLASLGAVPYQCGLVNSAEAKTGFGLFYRVPFGNTPNVAGNKPAYVPRPAYFALLQADRFLASWKFVKSVRLPDANPQSNRCYVYANAQGGIAAVLWRADQGQRSYALPAVWKGCQATDMFGFPTPPLTALTCTPMPLFIYLPTGYRAEQLIDDLRTLPSADGELLVLRDLRVSEADSQARANYRRTGGTGEVRRVGRIAAAGSYDAVFVQGIAAEQFEFSSPRAGNAVLTRDWFADGGAGQKLSVRLNDGPEQVWDLSFPAQESLAKFYPPGIRRSTFVLRDCRAGVNTVVVRYAAPGESAAYRVEPLPGDHVELSRRGLLTAVQSLGEIQRDRNASGGPLTIGKSRYETGLGSHASSMVECPLDGQFSRCEVTVGIDGSTDGKGSVVFRILVDGVEKVKTKTMTGFSKPETLSIDGLEAARRMTLVVEDSGDGQQNDLANWVDGKLFLKAAR